MMGLTPVQAKTMAAVRRLTHDGVSPSYDEIRREIGLASNAGVVRLLRGLKERGAIDFIPNRARSVRIVGELEGLDQRSSEDLRALRRNIDLILKGRAQ